MRIATPTTISGMILLALAGSASAPSQVDAHQAAGVCDRVIEAVRVLEGRVAEIRSGADEEGHPRTTLAVAISRAHKWPAAQPIPSTYDLEFPGGALSEEELVIVGGFNVHDVLVGDEGLFIVPRAPAERPWSVGEIFARDVWIKVADDQGTLRAASAEELAEFRTLSPTVPSSTPPPPSQRVTGYATRQALPGEGLRLRWGHRVEDVPSPADGLSTWDELLATVAACTAGGRP